MAIEVDFRVGGGELALVDARHSLRPAWLADLCCGLLPLSGGSVRFLGHDWSAMPQDYAAALRGRIGRVFQSGNWIDFMDVATNVLLSQLHHTRDDPIDLRERAIALSCAFGCRVSRWSAPAISLRAIWHGRLAFAPFSAIPS